MTRKLSKAEAHQLKLECLKYAVACYQTHQGSGSRWEHVLSAAKHFYSWATHYDGDDDE